MNVVGKPRADIGDWRDVRPAVLLLMSCTGGLTLRRSAVHIIFEAAEADDENGEQAICRE